MAEITVDVCVTKIKEEPCSDAEDSVHDTFYCNDPKKYECLNVSASELKNEPPVKILYKSKGKICDLATKKRSKGEICDQAINKSSGKSDQNEVTSVCDQPSTNKSRGQMCDLPLKESLQTSIVSSLRSRDSSKQFVCPKIKTEPDELTVGDTKIEIEIELERPIKTEFGELCSKVKVEKNYHESITKSHQDVQVNSPSYFLEIKPQPSGSSSPVRNEKERSAVKDIKPKDKKTLGYTCKSCYSYFASEQNLLVHIYKNQGAPGTPFKCKKKLRPSVLFCAVCNNKYRYKQHLIRHLKVHFNCKFCSKTFATVLEKDSHMMVHIDIKCKFCDTRFQNSLDLQYHIRDMHGDKPYECKHCGARFTTRNNLSSHETKHSDNRPFACHICNKAFKVNAKLKKHILTHESGNFVCEICNGSFKNIMSLRGHITHKHPNRKHKCTICDAEYDDRPSLIEHRKKHYQEFRFPCEICNKKFKYKQSLIDHGVIHSGEKPHCCIICSKLFTFKTNLTAHIRNVHKKKQET